MNETLEADLKELLRKADDMSRFDPGDHDNTRNWLIKQTLRAVVALLKVATSENDDIFSLSAATYYTMYVRLIVNREHAKAFKSGEAQDRAIYAEARKWGNG